MNTEVNEIKRFNPRFVWYPEEKLYKVVYVLKQNNFYWSSSRKDFYNEKLDLSISVQTVEKYIENGGGLEKEVLKVKEKGRRKKYEYVEDLKVAKKVINFLIFFVIINLFLGWMVFYILIWIFIEIFLFFFLFSFIKIKNRLVEKLNKENYVSR